MTVKRQFIDAKTGQIHLRVAGDPSSTKSIICLHMMPKSGRIYRKLLPELARQTLAIAPDFPGYGESSHFPEDYRPCVSDYADAVDEVINHFELEQVFLVGYHTGSMVAAELAYRRPQRVTKIVSLSAPIFTQSEIADFHNYYAPIALDQEGTRFRVMWERILHYAVPDLTLEMAADSLAENMRGGERYEDGHAAAFDYAPLYVKRLQAIKQPVWVMNLDDDLAEHSRRATNYINNGYLTEFPGWGHGCVELWPAEVAHEILNFFDTDSD